MAPTIQQNDNAGICVIGGGAAGLMAAIQAGMRGAKVTVLEKNTRVGRKIGITGKGRCNVTNAEAIADWMPHIITNPKFLFSALHQFTNTELQEMIESAGVPLKTERGNRVFPVSDKARDIIDALVRLAHRYHVRIENEAEVKEIRRDGDGFLIRTGSAQYKAERVILTTGGLSYPRTGSTGDGYRFAKGFGHSVTDLRPGLAPLIAGADWIGTLEGLSLRNVALSFTDRNGKKITEGFGEMLFTHSGISGPIVLTATSFLQKYTRSKDLTIAEAGITAHLNLKPALSAEQLDARLLRDLQENRLKQIRHALKQLLPERLIIPVLLQAGILPSAAAGELKREERKELVRILQDLTFPVTKDAPIEEAIITTGGVRTSEIDPKTMESRLVPGLYIAGELLDVDAETGGFNLQIAFSTGACAGRAAAGSLNRKAE